MKTNIKNVHGRINCRANMANKDKAFGQRRVATLFESSFDNDFNMKYENLYFYRRLSHYNKNKGFYN